MKRFRCAPLAVLVLSCALFGRAGEPAADLRAQRLAWYNRAKFGMFIHWGAYAVLARAKGRQLAEWVMHNERIPVAEYEKVVDQFKAEHFDPEAWVRAFQQTGVRYITLTSKHHDGFCLFGSKLTDYDAVDRGPRRDLLGDLTKACQKAGIRVCYYHSLLDWHHPDFNRDFPKYVEYCHGQVRELCTQYGTIDGIWFDGEWVKPYEAWRSGELVAMIRRLQPLAVINDRLGRGQRSRSPEADFYTHEQQIPGRIDPRTFHPWETCQTFGHSWGYHKDETNLKTPATVVRQLIDVASKGGNFLLNIGPRADGTIAPEHLERMAVIGQWMKTHGEAIYDSTYAPFRQPAYGRQTRVGNVLYLHLFRRPGDSVTVPTPADNVVSAALLGSGEKLAVQAEGEHARIALPAALPSEIASVLRIELKELQAAVPQPIQQAADGSVALPAAGADLHGQAIRVEERHGEGNIGWWSKQDEWASWDFTLKTGGRFAVELLAACAPTGGGAYVVACGEGKLEAEVPRTKGWDDFQPARPGVLTLPPGKHTLAVRAARIAGEGLMNIARITLRPAQ